MKTEEKIKALLEIRKNARQMLKDECEIQQVIISKFGLDFATFYIQEKIDAIIDKVELHDFDVRMKKQ